MSTNQQSQSSILPPITKEHVSKNFSNGSPKPSGPGSSQILEAQKHWNNDNYDVAYKFYHAAIQEGIQKDWLATAHNCLGQIEIMRGNIHDAVNHFIKCLAIPEHDPTDVWESAIRLYSIYDETGRSQEAQELKELANAANKRGLAVLPKVDVELRALTRKYIIQADQSIASQQVKNVGTIEIFRKAKFTASMYKVNIMIDDKQMGALSGNETLKFTIPSGVHTLRVAGSGLSRTISITISDGQYLRLQTEFSDAGILGGGLKLDMVPPIQSPSGEILQSPGVDVLAAKQLASKKARQNKLTLGWTLTITGCLFFLMGGMCAAGLILEQFGSKNPPSSNPNDFFVALTICTSPFLIIGLPFLVGGFFILRGVRKSKREIEGQPLAQSSSDEPTEKETFQAPKPIVTPSSGDSNEPSQPTATTSSSELYILVGTTKSVSESDARDLALAGLDLLIKEKSIFKKKFDECNKKINVMSKTVSISGDINGDINNDSAELKEKCEKEFISWRPYTKIFAMDVNHFFLCAKSNSMGLKWAAIYHFESGEVPQKASASVVTDAAHIAQWYVLIGATIQMDQEITELLMQLAWDYLEKNNSAFGAAIKNPAEQKVSFRGVQIAGDASTHIFQRLSSELTNWQPTFSKFFIDRNHFFVNGSEVQIQGTVRPYDWGVIFHRE